MIIILCKKKCAEKRIGRWLGNPDEEIVVIHPANESLAIDELNNSPWLGTLAVENYPDAGAVEKIVLDLASYNKINRIVSFSESDVIRAASLRERLGIPGQSLESAYAYRNKLTMKRRLAADSVSVPAFAELDSVLQVSDFARKHGWPVIIKPFDLAGSRNISVLRDKAQFESWAKATDAGPNSIGQYLVEAFIDADMYHVDGIMHDGIVDWALVSRYLVPPLTTLVHHLPIGGATLSLREPKTGAIMSLVRQTIATLPAPKEHTSFHAEILEDKNGALSVCEIASRTAGPRISEMIHDFSGVDLNRETARGQAGLPSDSAPCLSTLIGNAGWILIPPKQGSIRSLPRNCSISNISRYECSAQIGQTFTSNKKTSEHIAWAVARGASQESVEHALNEFCRWFEEQSTWTEDRKH